MGSGSCSGARLTRMKYRSPLAFALATLLSLPAYAQSTSGAAVYEKSCAACHDQVTARIPNREALQKMSSARIMRTLDFGLMMSIAYPLLSLGYVINAVGAWYLFGESVGAMRVAGIGLIIVGVYLIARS